MERCAEYVTVTIGSQLFGLPISRVQDVFVPERLTRVPLASADIAGLVNVRGRVLTLIEMWRRLELPAPPAKCRMHAVGVEHRGESYGLLIEQIGEVLRMSMTSLEDNPPNLDRRLAQVSLGLCRLDDRLMPVLDVDRLIDFDHCAAAAHVGGFHKAA